MAQDYCAANAAKHFLAGVTRPTLILHALDDPWIRAACYTAIDLARLPMIERRLAHVADIWASMDEAAAVPWHDRATAWRLARKGFGPDRTGRRQL